MKLFKVISILLVCILIGFLSLGLFIPSIEYTINLDIQAPISKGYNALASHDMKPLLYTNIIADKSNVQPFQQGNSTVITYLDSDSEKLFTEKIIKMDSLTYLEFSTETDKTYTNSKIHFTDKGLKTRLRIEEELTASSFIERSFIFFLKSKIIKNRTTLYIRRKQIIESTPDYSIEPNELK